MADLRKEENKRKCSKCVGSQTTKGFDYIVFNGSHIGMNKTVLQPK